jgi:predicted MFS family arabinose efflux permease
VHSADVGWTAPTTIATVGLGVVLLAGFLANQARVEQPLLPLRLLSDRRRAGAYGARFLFNGALVSFFFFMTQYLQGVAGFSALEAGLAFLPVTAAVIVAAMVTTRLRVSSQVLAVVGCAGMLIGTAWVSRVGMDTHYLLGIAVPMVIFGLGQGLGLSSLTTAGMAGVEPHDAGVAGGLVNVFHHLGGAVGVGILVTVFAAAGPTLAEQVSAALTGACVLLALALIVILATTRSEGQHADHPQQHRHSEGPGRLVHR